MPGKIKSGKQMRFMAGIAHGMKARHGAGPSPEVAEKMVHDETPATRSKLMKKKK